MNFTMISALKADGTYEVIVENYLPDTWYDIKAVIDVTGKICDFYSFDNMCVKYQATTSSAASTHFHFLLRSKNHSTTVFMYLLYVNPLRFKQTIKKFAT